MDARGGRLVGGCEVVEINDTVAARPFDPASGHVILQGGATRLV
jgi:hypothetical protein